MVFHVTQVSYAESLIYVTKHTNEEIVDTAADFINRLLDQVHYSKKGLMLDAHQDLLPAIKGIHLHQPFVADGVHDLVKRIDPLYVTLEYISRNREEHTRMLRQGVNALMNF